jgi:ligand-binding sensor domain-containing protein
MMLLFSAGWSEEWFSYTNSNDIRQVTFDSGVIWGATSGGIINYIVGNGDISKLTNTNGLSGIDYNCAEADGWLSKIMTSGEIINYPVVESEGGFFDRRIVIYDLTADGDVLWVANDLGVSKFLIYSNGGEIKDTAKKLGDLSDEQDILSIAVIGDYVWAGTETGIAFTATTNPNIQDPATWRSFGEFDFPQGRAGINTIAAYYDTVVVGVDSGLFKLEVLPDTNWVEMADFSNLRVRKILFHNGNLYVSTHAGVRIFDGISWSSITNQGLTSGIGDIIIDDSDDLWGGTRGSGLAVLQDTVWALYSIPGPASNLITKMAIDSLGGLWMTHDAKGLSRFSDGEWTIFNENNSGLNDNSAYSITAGYNNDLWIGTWGNGLYRYDGQSWYHWTSDNSPMYGVPNAHYYWAATDVEIDQYGNLWVSSLDADSGLVMGAFDPVDSIWNLYFEGPNTITENTVQALLSQGISLWVGTTQGLHRLNFAGTPFDQSDDSWLNFLIREFVADLALDPFGNLWVGSPTGLYYVESSTNITRQVELPLDISGSVKTVASDGFGNIWVGTVNGAGVLRPDKISWKKTYSTDNSPLLNNEVSDIEIDIQTGMVYLGTFGGLSIFDSGVEAPSEDLSDVEVYPNPVIVSQEQDIVLFKRVPSGATISIYTVSGDLVKSFSYTDQLEWNLKNSKNEPVAGGIYFFVVDYQGKTGTGKFAIIK